MLAEDIRCVCNHTHYEHSDDGCLLCACWDFEDAFEDEDRNVPIEDAA